MMVMPSQNMKGIVHYWCGRGYPVGWLFTPEEALREPCEWVDYAIDNGRFAVWDAGKEWREGLYLRMLDHYSPHPKQPLWVVVPDVVGDRDATLREWDKWYPVLSGSYDYKWAFCVQDGMTPEDVPTEAEVVFVGGTFEWKWRNLRQWVEAFDRVHVGRVNTVRHLLTCWDMGCESTDGTGWFRAPRRTDELHKFLRIQAGEEVRHNQGTLDLEFAA